MKIRRAEESDVPSMLALHRKAVRRTAASFYEPAVIESWSSGSDPDNAPQTIARMRSSISSGDVISFVAEIGTEIAGFGELLPTKAELGAVYVDPDQGRKGIGGRLMQAIEAAAVELERFPII